MSFSHLQRRAFLIGAITLAVLIALVLCYWQGVDRGVLPSPLQPIVQKPAAAKNQLAQVSARGPAGTQSQAGVPPDSSGGEPAEPLRSAQKAPITPLSAVRMEPAHLEPVPTKQISIGQVQNQSVPRQHEPRTEPTSPTRLDPAAEELAEHWLSNTNDRPVVRVRYEPGDILKLVELGRGLIVACSKDTAHSREVYLVSKPDVPALFAPYTKSVADRFSNYSLFLARSSELAQLTSTLPLYFPESASALTFVPDQALAAEIFGQVAKASQSLGGSSSAGKVFEGQLALHGNDPRFEVLDVRAEGERAPSRNF